MAFKFHEEAADTIFDKSCEEILEDGSKCLQQHCCHTTVCELGGDEDHFHARVCGECRMKIFWYLRHKTEETRLEKVEKVKNEGKDYFIATGYTLGKNWQYEHVNSRTLFDAPEEPLTEEIIAFVGERWLKQQETKPKEKQYQTKLTDFFN
ncbi:Hypothetical predicted protein [Paramuricea clavata]|uniref:Uncharacterized protein n=1 Tax=Paramuricea clavata TaxID=317549 RepID=A0A7D9D6L4_PARCT|nr:Hypothetical predicted protein [Paramuricea clavata]